MSEGNTEIINPAWNYTTQEGEWSSTLLPLDSCLGGKRPWQGDFDRQCQGQSVTPPSSLCTVVPRQIRDVMAFYFYFLDLSVYFQFQAQLLTLLVCTVLLFYFLYAG